MKARLLRKLLNDTQYIISNNDDYIAVGTSMCHDLISVDKDTLKVKYALDTFNKGRQAIQHEELEFIWDKLHDLIESGEIKDIIGGRDEIENPIPAFTVVDGKVVESVTDAFGWPNTDDNGVLMYNNTHFRTRDEAILYGIREYEAAKKSCRDRIKDIEEDLFNAKQRLQMYIDYVCDLESELS